MSELGLGVRSLAVAWDSQYLFPWSASFVVAALHSTIEPAPRPLSQRFTDDAVNVSMSTLS